MSELTQMSVEALLDAFRRRTLSPVEVVDACAARIERVDHLVGGFTSLCLDRARQEAVQAEDAWRRGEARPLEGVPFGAKDLFDSSGVETTYGSTMFRGHVPTADATAIRRAREAGALLVGKTQTHEFAWGITSVNEGMGSARNPWALDRVSGGSSGGSGVVLAADEVPLALGSDTGGSIRAPAAFCGIVGLKPTYGRVSGGRAWPLARSLDHPGAMARSPTDAALLLQAVAGEDLEDPSTWGAPPCEIDLDVVRRGLDGLTVGVCADLHGVVLADDIQAVFDASVEAVVGAGARLVDVGLPEAGSILPAFRAIQAAEALDTHRRAGLYPARRLEYGADVRGRLDDAAKVTVEDYLAGAREREHVRAGFERLLSGCDLLLTPVSASPPVPIGAETVEHRGAEVTFRELVMTYTTPQDLTGLPACAVRAGFDRLGIPVGVQLTGPRWSEQVVLRGAHGLFEALSEVQARRPALGQR